jgi:predicted nuclease of predicted toxin-antitoxin system
MLPALSLYVDENFPMPAVTELRLLGYDVLTTMEAGMAGQAIPDEEVLDFARKQRRVLVTLNRKHFVHLHQLQPDHSGIIVCTFDPDFVRLARRIDAAIESIIGTEGSAQLSGQLVRVNRPVS